MRSCQLFAEYFPPLLGKSHRKVRVLPTIFEALSEDPQQANQPDSRKRRLRCPRSLRSLACGLSATLGERPLLADCGHSGRVTTFDSEHTCSLRQKMQGVICA